MPFESANETPGVELRFLRFSYSARAMVPTVASMNGTTIDFFFGGF